jgi:hypothetical protein
VVHGATLLGGDRASWAPGGGGGWKGAQSGGGRWGRDRCGRLV